MKKMERTPKYKKKIKSVWLKTAIFGLAFVGCIWSLFVSATTSITPSQVYPTFTVGHKVQFEVTKNLAGVDYEWEFPDTTKLYGKSVTYVFSQPGNYTIKLTAKKEKHKKVLKKNISVLPNLSLPKKDSDLSEIDWKSLEKDPNLVSEGDIVLGSDKKQGNKKSAATLKIVLSATSVSEMNPVITVRGILNATDSSTRLDQCRFTLLEEKKIAMTKTVRQSEINKGTICEAKLDFRGISGNHRYQVRGNAKTNAGKTVTVESHNSITVTSPSSESGPEFEFVNVSKEPVTASNPLVKVSAKAVSGDVGKGIGMYIFVVEENGRVITSKSVRGTDVDRNGNGVVEFNLWQYPGEHRYFFKVTAVDKKGKRKTRGTLFAKDVKSTFNNRPPSGYLTGNTVGKTKDSFVFHAKFKDQDKDHLNYEWYVNNEKIDQKNSDFITQFKHPGRYVIKVLVEDGVSTRFTTKNAVESQLEVNVTGNEYIDAGKIQENSPPKVKIHVPSGTAGKLSTYFTFYGVAADPNGDEMKYEWTFGDGGKAYVQNVAYQYKNPGKYRVTFMASDGEHKSTDTLEIQVTENHLTNSDKNLSKNNIPSIDQNRPVIAEIRISETEISEENPIVHVGAKVAPSNVPIAKFQFTVLENGVPIMHRFVNVEELEVNDRASTKFDLWRFPGSHKYSFQATAVDIKGKQHSKISNINKKVVSTTSNSSPTGTLEMSNFGFVDDFFVFYADFTDPDGDALGFEWYINEKFKTTGTDIFPIRFDDPGTYEIELRVEDKKSTKFETETFVSKKGIIEISENLNSDLNLESNRAPTAKIFVIPGQIGNPSTDFYFYASAQDPDGDTLKVEWEFAGKNNDRILTSNAIYRFHDAGNYEVKLIVSDGINIAEDTITIEVNDLNIAPPNNTDLSNTTTEQTSESITMPQSENTENDKKEEKVFTKENSKINQDLLSACNSPVYLNPIFLEAQLKLLKSQRNTSNVLESDDKDLLDKNIKAVVSDKRKINIQSLQIQLLELSQHYQEKLSKKKDQAIINKIKTDNQRIERQVSHIHNCLDLQKSTAADISGTVNSVFFLYAWLSIDSDLPKFFEWDFGDGRTEIGQDVRIQYLFPGRYEVTLTVSDGLTFVSDSITIKVTEK